MTSCLLTISSTINSVLAITSKIKMAAGLHPHLLLPPEVAQLAECVLNRKEGKEVETGRSPSSLLCHTQQHIRSFIWTTSFLVSLLISMTTDCCCSGVEQLHNPDQRDLPVPLPDNKLPAQYRLPVLHNIVLPAALSPIAISSKTAVVTGGTALTLWCSECKSINHYVTLIRQRCKRNSKL